VTMTLRWLRREPPLACAAVAGSGAVAERLRLAAADRVAAGARLRACADAECVVVLGDTGDLPWADGAVFLGWDSGVLVPTTLVPSVPADLLRRAVCGTSADLVAVMPGCVLVSSVPVRAADARLLARR
jgi:MoxR-vWA-beta-propeller ternary system protein